MPCATREFTIDFFRKINEVRVSRAGEMLLGDKCQLIADTEKCHEIADSRVNATECLSAGR